MDHQNREVNPIDTTEEAALVADLKAAVPFLEELDNRNVVIDFSPIVDGEHEPAVTIAPFRKHRNSGVDLRSWTIDRKDLPRVLITQRQATPNNPLRFRFEEVHIVGENEKVLVPASPDTARESVQILLNAAKRNQEQLVWDQARKRSTSRRWAAIGHHVLDFFHPQHT